MQWGHSNGHPGIHWMITLIQNAFWWLTLITDVMYSVRTCQDTLTAASRSLELLSILQNHGAVDIVTYLPSFQGYTTIFVIINQLSKACRLVPLKGLTTAIEAAKALFHYVFLIYGLPEDIVSNKSTQFMSQLWRAFLWTSTHQH